MMNPLIRSSLITAAIFLLGAAAYSQTTRIHFKHGATSAVVTGNLKGLKDKKVFVIRVRKGQVLTTENADDNYITVAVDPPKGTTFEDDMAADCHDKHEVNPTAAGDYKIYVTECLKADAWRGKFRLRVTVR
jgi:hypothetical protein